MREQKSKRIIAVSIILLLVVALIIMVYFFATKDTGFLPKSGLAVALPNFALKNRYVKAAYLAAYEKMNEFQYLPCYCGCGMSEMEHRGKTISKHNSLKECFIKANGSWEDHAAMDCTGCINTALDAYQQLQKGLSLKEVRNYIDKKYGNAFGTNTPMPE